MALAAGRRALTSENEVRF